MITQASADPRFADHPGCARLGIESYIAVPLHRRDGTFFGTLCALDPLPSDLSEDHLEVLSLLADLIAFQLEGEDDRRRRERDDDARRRFVDAAAHDLKGPLTVARGQAQLLRRRLRRHGSVDRATLDEGLQGIAAAVSRTGALIDDLLDAAHLEAGRPLDLRYGEVDLAALVRDRVDERQRGTGQHAIRLAPGAAVRGSLDAGRMGRVLDNLLDNATKYSPAGGDIDVAVRGVGDGWAEIVVADRGVGIPAADLPHIFERFRRGRNVGGIAGTGIGLDGARQIVAQHGGTIAVESLEGQGSVFTVRIPLVPPPG